MWNVKYKEGMISTCSVSHLIFDKRILEGLMEQKKKKLNTCSQPLKHQIYILVISLELEGTLEMPRPTLIGRGICCGVDCIHLSLSKGKNECARDRVGMELDCPALCVRRMNW